MNTSPGTPVIIETRVLTVYYGRQRGILNVNLQVGKGEVFGFLGPNGAGKTTTVRVLLDVIHPTRGHCFMLGLDCQKEGPTIRQRVGYLPGELHLPETMTARQFFEVLAATRGIRRSSDWPKLCERLELDPTWRLREYSHGNKRKVGLIAALMHRPEVVILDEPSLGLDPLVQQTVLEIIQEMKREGRTVFLSSHNLSEVQAVCDRVGMLRDGRLITVESIETLVRRRFRRLRLSFERPPSLEAFRLEGVTEIGRSQNAITLEIRDNLHTTMQRALQYGLNDIEEFPVTLEEVFLAYYGADVSRGGIDG